MICFLPMLMAFKLNKVEERCFTQPGTGHAAVKYKEAVAVNGSCWRQYMYCGLHVAKSTELCCRRSVCSVEKSASAYFGATVLALTLGTPSGVPAGHTELAVAMAHIAKRRHTEADTPVILPARLKPAQQEGGQLGAQIMVTAVPVGAHAGPTCTFI